MFVRSTDPLRIPIKIWQASYNDIEQSCLDQADNLARLPFAYHHVALMPDTHSGYGMPIGGVLATKNVIIPNAVGVDIGCGIAFCQTNIPISVVHEAKTKDGQPLLKFMLAAITRNVPVGFAHHKEPQEWSGFDNAPSTVIVQQQIDPARFQLGTLGGGNHFIEIQEDSSGNLCIMIHSGSRNFGKQICDYYNARAKTHNEKWFSSVPKEHDLAFLPIDSNDGHDYYESMKFALEFARENRRLMMERVKNLVFNLIEKYHGHVSKAILNEVNAHHNYAAMEHHFGENVFIHRKGAIRAREGDPGIIPGSMEAPSYIVEGLGNPDSFHSASHGAGRRMSRARARKTYKVNDFIEGLNKKGIVLQTPDKAKVIDECGEAYKKIDDVIEQEKDLVKVTERVTQIGVIKG